jgi:deazaflavin-dependent oxidoreductase (nitroreductase family)
MAGPEWHEDDFCYLTTTGRITGQPHTIEIWFGARDATLFMLSGGGRRADWVRNIVAEPSVQVRVRSRTFSAAARVVEGAKEEALARRLLAAKYQGWREGAPLSRWAGTALPIAVDLPEDR